MTHPFIEHLKKDHETQRQLADKLSAAKTKEEKEHYRQAFADALYPHLEGEDASIFKYLKSKGGEARKGALEAMEEHHVDRVLLRELMKLEIGDEKFTAKAKVLNEINAHHLEEEEEEHFPRLESLAGKEKLDELFEAYELREEEVNENELLMA
jgi:hemerythrin-like domain-containing protein